MALDKLIVRGAREHNLKNVDLEIPRDKMVVITGLSGSGKSSLAFDTIYAEGQRRYVESLSSYARQFLGLMEKPNVDQIEGLSPAISIDQKGSGRNPRSTVGTVTEVYLPMDRTTNRPRGFAFVTMGAPSEMQEAIKGLNQKDFMGRPLAINEARPKEDRPAYAGAGGGGGGGGRGRY